MRLSVALGVAVLVGATPAAAITAVPGPIQISDAWAPAPAKQGDDAPLYMSVTNNGDVADSLVRARCSFAQFTGKVTVDSGGEGSPATREVKAIPVPAHQTVLLKPGGYHLVLTQTTEPLRAGQVRGCTITFRKNGERLVEVTIVKPGTTAFP